MSRDELARGGVPVPPLLVGPLVDNALKYGSQTSRGARSVAVEARVHGDQLVIEVTNSGAWVEPKGDRLGTGLANLRRRLEIEARAGSVTARVATAGRSSTDSPAPSGPWS